MQTSRLLLRKFQIEDAKELFDLNNDWDCIKFTGDEPFESIEQAEEFIKNYDHYQKYGFGRWSVLHRETNEFLGWCGLKYSPEVDEYDIGFRFHKKFWGQGYATEAAAFCIHIGFTALNIKEIIGRAETDNTASVKVLEKLDMKLSKVRQIKEKEWLIYSKSSSI